MSFSYAQKGSHRTLTLEVDAETYRRIEREAAALKLSLRAYVKARVMGYEEKAFTRCDHPSVISSCDLRGDDRGEVRR